MVLGVVVLGDPKVAQFEVLVLGEDFAHVLAITLPACFGIAVRRLSMGASGAAVQYCAHGSQITKMSSTPITKMINIAIILRVSK